MKNDIKKILIVDDEPDITYIIDFVLKNGGFDVEKINDSTLAPNSIEENDYSLMILDLMMPKLDGFSLLKQIRDTEKGKTLKVLILSSRQLSSEETEMIGSLNASVMAKPFEPYRLLDKVREMVTTS